MTGQAKPAVRRLVVATRNEGKRKELAELLADLGVEVLSLADFPEAPEVEEPYETFAENAAEKATVIARETGEWAVADDSGLVVDALGGEPGVHSSRIAATDTERITWVLGRMAQVAEGSRQAHFACVVALASPEGLVGEWEGAVQGTIAQEPAGTGGFGFDPVFYYPPAGKTFAQMSRQEKSAVSHRGQALIRFREAFGAFCG